MKCPKCGSPMIRIDLMPGWVHCSNINCWHRMIEKEMIENQNAAIDEALGLKMMFGESY